MAIDKASVPFIITKDQKQQLLDLGYKKTQINKLTPQEAHEILGILPRASETWEHVEIPQNGNGSNGHHIPQHLEAEKTILGVLIFGSSRELFKQVLSLGLVSQHFYLPSSRLIFEAMLEIYGRGDLVDMVVLPEECRRRKTLDQIGGAAYITSLTDGVPRFSDLSGQVRLVRSAYRRRFLLEFGNRIQKKALSGDHDGEALLLEIKEEITQVSRGIHVTSDYMLLSEVEELPVEWLWQPRIPLQEITMIQGEEGIGKSTMVVEIAAAVTKGGGLQDLHINEPGRVLWFAAEDSYARTLKPRMLAAGADCSKIMIKKSVFKLNTRGILEIADQIESFKPTLVVIDPIISYCDGDPNKAEVARATTGGLRPIAEEFNCAIVLLRHIGKAKGGGDPRAAGLYSIEWRAAVRSELLVGCDPDERTKIAVTHTKHNLSPQAESLGYEIRSDITSPSGAKFYWTGKSELTSERILQKIAEDDEERSYRNHQKVEASDFLKDLLSGGAIPQKNIQSEANAAGVSYRTLERLKHTLHVRSFSKGNGSEKIWFWEMNGVPEGSGVQPKLGFEASENRSEGRQTENVAVFDNSTIPKNNPVENPKAANSEKCVGSDPHANTANGGLRKKRAVEPLESTTPKTATEKKVAVFGSKKKNAPKDESNKTHCVVCGAKLDENGKCEFPHEGY